MIEPTHAMIDEWRRASKELLIDVEFNVVIRVDGKILTTCPVLVRDFGNTNGMLIFEYNESIKVKETLINEGYGYAIMPFDPIDSFDIESFKSVLCDWRWAGPKDKIPRWVQKCKDVDSEF